MGVDIICLPFLNLPSVSFSLLKSDLHGGWTTQWLIYMLSLLNSYIFPFFFSYLCFIVHILFWKNHWISKEIRIFTPKNTQHLQIAVDTYIFSILSAPSEWYIKWCSVLTSMRDNIREEKISWRKCIYIFFSIYLFRISAHYRRNY